MDPARWFYGALARQRPRGLRETALEESGVSVTVGELIIARDDITHGRSGTTFYFSDHADEWKKSTRPESLEARYLRSR